MSDCKHQNTMLYVYEECLDCGLVRYYIKGEWREPIRLSAQTEARQ